MRSRASDHRFVSRCVFVVLLASGLASPVRASTPAGQSGQAEKPAPAGSSVQRRADELSAAAGAGALAPARSEERALLERLLAQVAALQQRVVQLEAALQQDRVANAGTTVSPTPAAAAPADAPADAPAAGASGLSVAVGGYGSFRLDAGDAPDQADSLTLRRFVVTTDARYGERLQVYSEIELERLSEIELERGVERQAGGLTFEQELEGPNGGEISVEQAWAQFNLGRGFGLRMGAVLPPVGRFNLRHDDDRWNFPRRPLIDRGASVLPAKAAWTEMGIGAVGEVDLGEQAVLSYQAYLLNGTLLDSAIEQKVQTRVPKRNKLELEAVVSPSSGAFDGSNPLDAFAARVQISPRLGTEFAVSAYHGEYTPEYLDATGSLTTLGFDGAHRAGPFQLEGEFLYSRYGNVDEVLREFAAAAVDKSTETESEETAALETEIEVELKGLSKRRYGFWFDVGMPLALEPGFLGLEDAVLIPSVRYERVWFDDDLSELDFSGGTITELVQADRRQERLSVGFAFRPVPGAVFHLFYERNHALEGLLIDPGVPARTTNGFTFGMAVGF